MNEQTFNIELKKVAKDLVLDFDHVDKKWAVYQLTPQKIMTMGRPKPWKLFNVETEKGEFRLPDKRDIIRVFQSVDSSRRAWEKGSDWYVNKLESKEKKIEERNNARLEDNSRQASKEAAQFISGRRTTRV